MPNLFLLQAWIPAADTESFNSVAWSISVEFYIYIIFAFILTVFGKVRNPVFAGIAIFALAALHWEWYVLKPAVLSGLSCFFLGSLAYEIYERLQARINAKAAGFFIFAECILVLAIYLLLPSDVPAKRLLITLLFSVTVIVFAFEMGPVSRLLKKSVINYLGKLSYSIYITHFGILTVLLGLAMVAGKILKFNFTPMVGDVRYITTGNLLFDNLLVLAILTLIVFISSLTYRFIELKGIGAGKRLKSLGKPAARTLQEEIAPVPDKFINQHGKQTN
ncbi:acyltransferase [Chitinophaga caseinilytica]|uniref:Acyltransferase n=1 Tax=Chitinophaga caseinilytica TaxID=2267521 RepID=A0ABZ2Z8B1_9BACT